MSVTLSPMAPRYAVSDADDPFKKYWWAILGGIGFTAAWLLMPMAGEKSIGSTVVDTSKPKIEGSVEQSFADGDVGNGLNLSMEEAIKRRKEDPAFSGSSLMLPTPEGGETADAAAAGSAAGGAASGAKSASLAAALKEVGQSNGGWGDKKAQRGFDQPKLSGSGMSGLGSAGGGRSGSAGGTSAFGSSNANVGFGRAGGLSGSVKDDVAPAAKGSIAALKALASQSVNAANNSSNDAARSSLAQAFDGAKAGSKIGGPGGGPGGARYDSLDTAPINLKLSDPKLNEKKLEAPPPSAPDPSKSAKGDDAEMAKQLMMTVVGGVLGGVIGGPVGGIVTNVLMQAVQRQEAQQKKIEEMQEKQMERQQRAALGLKNGP